MKTVTDSVSASAPSFNFSPEARLIIMSCAPVRTESAFWRRAVDKPATVE